jgi:hypothetical protein
MLSQLVLLDPTFRPYKKAGLVKRAVRCYSDALVSSQLKTNMSVRCYSDKTVAYRFLLVFDFLSSSFRASLAPFYLFLFLFAFRGGFSDQHLSRFSGALFILNFLLFFLASLANPFLALLWRPFSL